MSQAQSDSPHFVDLTRGLCTRADRPKRVSLPAISIPPLGSRHSRGSEGELQAVPSTAALPQTPALIDLKTPFHPASVAKGSEAGSLANQQAAARPVGEEVDIDSILPLKSSGLGPGRSEYQREFFK